MGASNSTIASLNETTFNAFVRDAWSQLKRWEGIPCGGEIFMRLFVAPDGCAKAEYVICGQVCSEKQPMFRPDQEQKERRLVKSS